MLDARQATPPQFIKSVHDTGATMRVPRLLKAVTEENDWLNRKETDDETFLQDDLSVMASPSALEQLKALANHAVAEAERRHRQESLTVAILEELANGATCEMQAVPAQVKIDIQETCYKMPSMPKSESGSQRVPTSYKNATLSPRVLLMSAVLENTRYMGARAVPKNLYVHDDVIEQLPQDMMHTSGEEFNGYLPFREFGDGIRIPVLSAKKALGIDLPRDEVWCSN